MKIFKNFLLVALTLLFSFVGNSQTIDIFVFSNFGVFPEIPVINTTYTTAGFTTVNITQGTVDPTLTTANYDVAYITEYYTLSGGGCNTDFLTAAEQVIVEAFIAAGGHVVWIAESWSTCPVVGGPVPPNLNAVTTINNLYGTGISYGTYFNNGGMGSPNAPQIHQNSGPASLSGQGSVITSGSYATLNNVPACNALYTPDFFDNTNFFEACASTILAVFPATPVSGTGSVIISTELGLPFHGTSVNGGFPPVPPVYNNILDASIAAMHFNLLTGGTVNFYLHPVFTRRNSTYII